MSDSDFIVIAGSDPPPLVARKLAEALGAEVEQEGDQVRVVVAGPEPGLAWAGGELWAHAFGTPPDPDPDELTVLDGYPLAWSIEIPSRDEDALHRVALAVFRRLADAGWPAPILLLAGVSRLVAGYRPGGGVVPFPPRTGPDADDRDVWADFDLVER